MSVERARAVAEEARQRWGPETPVHVVTCGEVDADLLAAVRKEYGLTISQAAAARRIYREFCHRFSSQSLEYMRDHVRTRDLLRTKLDRLLKLYQQGQSSELEIESCLISWWTAKVAASLFEEAFHKKRIVYTWDYQEMVIQNRDFLVNHVKPFVGTVLRARRRGSDRVRKLMIDFYDSVVTFINAN